LENREGRKEPKGEVVGKAWEENVGLEKVGSERGKEKKGEVDFSIQLGRLLILKIVVLDSKPLF
jgi:hypothetical protein